MRRQRKEACQRIKHGVSLILDGSVALFLLVGDYEGVCLLILDTGAFGPERERKSRADAQSCLMVDV